MLPPPPPLLAGSYRHLAPVLLLLWLRSGAAGTVPAPNGGDRAALEAFKEAATAGGALASWNSSTGYCGWVGVTCGGRGHRWRVVSLDLHSRGLDGTISPAIGNLTFLRSLNLSFNGLRGQIPPSVGSLRRLRYLNLRGNALAGAIPGNITRCASLRELVLADNKGLTGSIPAAIGGMPLLSVLHIANNSITGPIPPSLGNLSRLTRLALSNNYLQGTIPASIGNNGHLRLLYLFSNNLSASQTTWGQAFPASSRYRLRLTASPGRFLLPSPIFPASRCLKSRRTSSMGLSHQYWQDCSISDGSTLMGMSLWQTMRKSGSF
ncbi:hypothetical protein PAHAL_1G074800 [Panicum hallii]|uniref:Leucine-rich repeat-containing N-terminal plant-type domain-containing protein n=1 Tax=Panicum hallii TaxID=206008 RepID=A0A2S3GM65_9POAL|nr:hypothetical protein PAHAL_1G074800 [Panicum hallii]